MCGVIRINKVYYKPGSILNIQTKSGNQQLRWGLQRGSLFHTNTRVESMSNDTYWDNILKNRCLINCDGFEEQSGLFIPHGPNFLLGGLYEPENGFSIITIPSGSVVSKSWHRQPIILYPDEENQFFNGKFSNIIQNKNKLIAA